MTIDIERIVIEEMRQVVIKAILHDRILREYLEHCARYSGDPSDTPKPEREHGWRLYAGLQEAERRRTEAIRALAQAKVDAFESLAKHPVTLTEGVLQEVEEARQWLARFAASAQGVTV